MTTNKHTDDSIKEEVFDCDSWIKWVNAYTAAFQLASRWGSNTIFYRRKQNDTWQPWKEVKERERMLIHEAIETGLIADVSHLIS
jgi:hypothetical protein